MSALVLAGIILSGAWTQLDEIGWLGWTPVILAFLLDLFPVASARWTWPSLPATAIDRTAMAAAAALCAMALAHLALTFREEFGFGGDEGYHLSATRAFAIYFLRAGPILAIVVFGYAGLLFKRVRFAGSVAAVALLAASYALPASALFGRYPTAFYLLATPLNVAFDAINSPYPYSANHLVNSLSLPAWLLVLRPLIIGRWPDWRGLIVAVLVYVQPAALTFLSSPLLEPWAVVFALLSVEALSAFEPERRWIAVPLCAIAVCFKETFILLLPTVWLMSCVEWRNLRPLLRPGAVAVGIAAVAPFLTYLIVRATMTEARGYGVGGTEALISIGRVVEWTANLRAQVGIGSLIAIAGTIAATILAAPIWIATALGTAAFFLADAVSVPWTGYARFQIYSLLAICAAVFTLTYRRTFDRRTLIGCCAVIAALQLPGTLQVFALDLQPDHERNSLDWYRNLIRLPVRALASQISVMEGGARVRRIRVVTVGTDLTSLHVAYPDLASRFELVGDQQQSASPDCRCRDDAEAVIAGFEWPANMGSTPEAWASFTSVSAACVSQIETTCLGRSMVRDRSGSAVGALGVGKVLLLSPQYD